MTEVKVESSWKTASYMACMAENKTTIERAFELARSGEYARIGDMVRHLRREGYDIRQIHGPVLRKQLADLIEAARTDHRENTEQDPKEDL
ncbi:hypothetical protein [Methylocystis sp. H62]|uniref:hypothetical protein n=2 Tax=unclassified Methylocystis TaxID=2625913 RepID=UPI001FEE0305|nr:hypothetical protein [Methylocystis sp. H62]